MLNTTLVLNKKRYNSPNYLIESASEPQIREEDRMFDKEEMAHAFGMGFFSFQTVDVKFQFQLKLNHRSSAELK